MLGTHQTIETVSVRRSAKNAIAEHIGATTVQQTICYLSLALDSGQGGNHDAGGAGESDLEHGALALLTEELGILQHLGVLGAAGHLQRIHTRVRALADNQSEWIFELSDLSSEK